MTSFPLRRAVAPASVPRALALALAATLVLGLGACREKKQEAAAPQGPHSLNDALEALLVKPDAQLRAQTLERVRSVPATEKTAIDGNRIVAVGLSPDYWTTDGRPAAVLVTNDTGAPLTPTLQLATYAEISTMPKVIVDDGAGKKEMAFKTTGVTPYELSPVPPGETRLFIVDVEKTWQPGAPDTRQLGVQILPTPQTRQANDAAAAAAPAAPAAGAATTAAAAAGDQATAGKNGGKARTGKGHKQHKK